jgi:hypothetical protein
VEPAPAGSTLASAQLLVTYNGSEPTAVIGDYLDFDMVAGSTVFGDDVGCVSLEFDDLFFDPTIEASPGEGLPRPQVCRAVPVDALGSLLLRATHVPTGTEYWFDLSEPS